MASYSSTSLSSLSPASLLFVLLISFLCTTTSIAEVEHLQAISHPANPPSHAPAPSPYHHHHHHHHNNTHHHNHTRHVISPAPAHSPSATPPTQMPSKPPLGSPYAKAPVPQPPSHAPAPAHAPHVMPPRKLVAVEGVVYCKNCSYSAVDTLVGASPLSGARVQLRCRNTKYLIKKASTTDHNGYFLLEAPPLITTYGAHKCRVFLIDTPKSGGGPCSHPTNLNGGVSGALLFLNKSSNPHPADNSSFALFNVGPLAYEPSTCHKH